MNLAADVRSGKVTATELVQASLDKLAETAEYHTTLEISQVALKRAQQIDRQIADGKDVGPLAGVPFIAKDNFLTADTHTTAASKILEPFRAPYQAVAIERLEAAGAIMVAKANLDAFGHGASTENSDFGPTKNPHDPARVPGGSSGGSAAAVALGQAPFSIGTDTGGSSRLPASYSGVVGFKPTYGLIPRTGVVAMGSSFDTIGTLANSAADVATVLDVLAGSDASDATSIERAKDGYRIRGGNLKGLKVGIIKEHLSQEAGIDPVVREQLLALIERLKKQGAQIVDISVPALQYALAAYYILVSAEISSNLARYDGIKFGHRAPEATNLEETYRLSREQGFGAEAKRRIMIGTYVLSSGYYDAYYKRAQRVRTLIIEGFEKAFKECDFLIGPTAATAAFALGSRPDPLAMYLTDIMTVAANLTGVPAISLPFAADGKLPLGVHIMAPQKQERELLQAAVAIEEVVGDWRQRS